MNAEFVDYELALVLGPAWDIYFASTGLTMDEWIDELGRVWRTRGHEARFGAQAGRRPWAWWHFTAQEERPATPALEATRLGELGELTEAEQRELKARVPWPDDCARIVSDDPSA